MLISVEMKAFLSCWPSQILSAVTLTPHQGQQFTDDDDGDNDESYDSDLRNLDPTRHTNSDALKAHIITFEVTILRLNCD